MDAPAVGRFFARWLSVNNLTEDSIMNVSRIRVWSIGAIAAVLLAASGVIAQPGQGRRSGAGTYDPKTETTISGTVESVQTVGRGRGRRGLGGLHIILTTPTASVEVHVGPVAYLRDNGITIETGDRLDILGSRVTVDGKPVLIARQITRGDKIWTLRNEFGRPRWSGGWQDTR